MEHLDLGLCTADTRDVFRDQSEMPCCLELPSLKVLNV